MKQMTTPHVGSDASREVRPSSAMPGFLASAAGLVVAVFLFVGTFMGGEPRLTPPKEDVVEKLAEHKRQMMRRYAQPVVRPDEAPARIVDLGSRGKFEAPSRKDDLVNAPADPSSGTAVLPPVDPEVARAIAQIDEGHIGDAVEILTAILKRDPNNEQALVEMAMIHLLDMKDGEQAVGYLQRVIQINPANQIVMTELVGLYEEQGRMEEGLRYLQDIAQQHPQSMEVAYGLGQMLAIQGRDAEAIPHLERASVTGADQVRALRDLAEAYSRTGDPERAIEVYAKEITVLEKDLKDKQALGMPVQYVEEKLNYAKLDKVRELIRIGDFESAQELLDEAEAAMPGNESVMALRSKLARSRAG